MSVIIPAHNSERTIGAVLVALAAQVPAVDEVIVVDDGSTDATASAATAHGARVIRCDGRRYAGGARNRGWEAAEGEIVVFLDSDAIPAPNWGAGLERALREFPGAIIGCARTFTARTEWAWVAHLQFETPYLPRGEPREVSFLSSYCMAVPRSAPLRWDESYGGEDGLFSVDALGAGMRLLFDPRFHAVHDHDRESFADLRRQQRRFAYGFARGGTIQREGLRKRLFTRIPLHHFALVRLALIYGRLRADRVLRGQFLRLLPRLIVAEWMLGFSATRYVFRRPSLRGGEGPVFS